jgi:hypothetical protein
MRLIDTAIDIHASAARVWSILTDFSAYSAWNPFITFCLEPVHHRSRG